MKPQIKEQFKKMEKFVNNANEIARGVDLEKLTNDIPYQYSLLFPYDYEMTKNMNNEEMIAYYNKGTDNFRKELKAYKENKASK